MTVPFRPGDRVRVSADHPWAANAEATVTEGWPTWPRDVHDERGNVTTFVLVTFDTPRENEGQRYESAELDARQLGPA